MIAQLMIEGYKSLADVSIELRSLNVLVGPNGAGKSNLLDALDLLRNGALGLLSQGLQLRGGFASLRSAFQDDPCIRFAAALAGAEGRPQHHYRLEAAQQGAGTVITKEQIVRVAEESGLFEGGAPGVLRLNRSGEAASFWNVTTDQFDAPVRIDPSELAISQVRQPNLYADVAAVWSALVMTQVFEPAHPGRFSPQRYPRMAAREWFLHRDASNLATVLSTRLADDRFHADFDHFVRLAFPAFKRVHFQPDPSGEGRIQLTWYDQNLNRGLSLGELSDGMVAYLTLLAILLHPMPGSIICIDEPEAGLHPRMLEMVADLIRAASESAQVVISTHSASLVSLFEPRDVLVVEAPGGKSEFRRLSSIDLGEWLSEFSIGDLMTMGKLESAD